MLQGAYFFETTQDAPGLFDSFLGGYFYIKGLPLLFQLLTIALFSLSVGSALVYQKNRNKKFESLSIFLTVLFFFCATLLLIQPWDELFVNLLHAKNLSESGKFSFNLLKPTEGTVDFLPYFLIGVFSKIGLPPLEMAFAMSLLGGILCLWICSLILKDLGVKNAALWVPLCLATYPPLLYNASQGFSTTLFSACILAISYFFFIQKKGKIAWVLLAILPLIRTEGAACLVLFPTLLWMQGKKKKILFYSLLSSTPIIALSLWRGYYFGHIIPAPIQFKSAMGNFFFLLIGIRNFLSDSIANYTLLALIVLWYLKRIGLKTKATPLLSLLAAFFFFTIPYYLSGGDWFPSAWSRYMLPFALFTLLTLWYYLDAYLKSTAIEKPSTPILCFLFIAVLFLVFFNPFASYAHVAEDLFSLRKTLANTTYRKQKRTNYRIEYLSRVGMHLKETTESTAVIASSEIATIMYFANREPLDCLGLTNYDIIKEPLRTPNLVRKMPKHHELPYLIFRRVNPAIVGLSHPQVVYPFDFSLPDIMEENFFSEFDASKVKQGLTRWQERFQDLMEPLYGGTQTLERLGYKPVIVKYANEFATLYFIEEKSLERHITMLKEKNFQGGYLSFLSK